MQYLHFVADLSLFNEVVALLLLTVVLSAISIKLRQPLVVGFIAAGILAGPSFLGWTKSSGDIRLLSEIGLSLLLFVVGLRLDVGQIRRMGTVSLVVGVAQIVLTSALGYFLALILGMPPLTSLYVSVALTLSSTVIIVKMLSDRRETESLYGRIVVGILIVQDIFAILAMIAITAYGSGGDGNTSGEAWFILLKGLSLLSGVIFAMYVVIPRILNSLAKSPELLVLFAISWALTVAGASEVLGLSKEIGAFLAGVSLASTEYREMIGARLISLRDFLLLFFFVDLGMGLNLSGLGRQIWKSVPLSAFVLIGDPLIVIAALGVLGYRKRTSFLSGLMVSQVSEFSLILAALGLRLHHISEDVVGLITLVALTTIACSTYLIEYSDCIYEKLSRRLGIFERHILRTEQSAELCSATEYMPGVILFGLGRYGTGIGRHLEKHGYRIYGVDFDPEAVRRWKDAGGRATFGDAEDPEFPSTLPLSCAKWVISAFPDKRTNLSLIKSLKESNYGGSIAVTAGNSEDLEQFRVCGADIVFFPLPDAASRAVDVLVSVDEELRRHKMNELIAEMKDHYVVCGFGRMGQQISKDFLLKGTPFVVIEDNCEQIPKLKEGDILYVEGKASDDGVLKAAGIERAKGLIAVNPTDEENVFIVLTARGLNSHLFIVARSILKENENKLKRAGANKVVSPYVLGGHRMAEAVLNPRTVEFMELISHYAHENTEIGVVTVGDSSECDGAIIGDSSIRNSTGVLILAVNKRDGGLISNPPAKTRIEAGDELVVMGTAAQVSAAASWCGDSSDDQEKKATAEIDT